jgi:hypothetical protein
MRLLISVTIGGLISFLPVTSNADNSTSPELCSKIRDFSIRPSASGSRSISFHVTKKSFLGEKECRPIPYDSAGIEFCDYVLSHTSIERLAPNLSQFIACLQTGGRPPTQVVTDRMIGKFRMYDPLDLKNVEVEFEYYYSRESDSRDGFSFVVKNSPDE